MRLKQILQIVLHNGHLFEATPIYLQLQITSLSPPLLLSNISIQLEEAIRLTPKIGALV